VNLVNRYTATKEEAKRLLDQFKGLQGPLGLALLESTIAFLQAASKRLPSKRSIDNDRVRRLRKKHGSIGEDQPGE